MYFLNVESEYDPKDNRNVHAYNTKSISGHRRKHGSGFISNGNQTSSKKEISKVQASEGVTSEELRIETCKKNDEYMCPAFRYRERSNISAKTQIPTNKFVTMARTPAKQIRQSNGYDPHQHKHRQESDLRPAIRGSTAIPTIGHYRRPKSACIVTETKQTNLVRPRARSAVSGRHRQPISSQIQTICQQKQQQQQIQHSLNLKIVKCGSSQSASMAAYVRGLSPDVYSSQSRDRICKGSKHVRFDDDCTGRTPASDAGNMATVGADRWVRLITSDRNCQMHHYGHASSNASYGSDETTGTMRFWHKYPTPNGQPVPPSPGSRLCRDPRRLPDCVRTAPAIRCKSARVRRCSTNGHAPCSVREESTNSYARSPPRESEIAAGKRDEVLKLAYHPRTPYNSPKCSVIDDAEFIDLINIY